jgi:cell division protein FtsI (penicillin-binding protein 3)|tara:strand:- start:10602 stop:12170 length:1569 start_codon:yes stop_codon:yes gene_type:complete
LLASLPIRFYFLQKNEYEIALTKSKKISERAETLLSRRGKIFDKNLVILAEDIPAYEIGIQVNDFSFNPSDILSISNILLFNLEKLKNKLSNKKIKYIVVSHNASQDQLDKINKLKISGIRNIAKYKRSYPEGKIMSQVIGLTDFNNNGQEGIELSINKKLSGINGKKKFIRTKKGKVIDSEIEAAINGQDIVTTLDSKIQYLVYEELKEAVNFYKASSASAILVNLKNRNILAMANYPSFDPNNRRGMDASLLSNRAVTDLFEPGSTIKPLSLAGLVEEKIINSNTKIETSPGFIDYKGFVTRDFKNYGLIDLSEVISKSSNVAMVKLCDKAKADSIIKNLYRWGFGKYMNEIFISTREGYLPNSENLSDREKVSLCYGYGMQITLAQLVAAYSALFDEGNFKGLNLILGSFDAFDEKVISSELAKDINTMLLKTVEEGTGIKAKVKGIKISGKTGTTKRLGSLGYTEESYNASFIGNAKFANNDFVIGILIRDAKENGEGGSQVAAPVFSKILKSIQNIY